VNKKVFLCKIMKHIFEVIMKGGGSIPVRRSMEEYNIIFLK
jgi:hypothetical protein